MKGVDVSPPDLPSLDQQRDALQKGLGRAMQWALAGRLAEEPLLDACLQEKRFDKQCEDNRGAWLWSIMQAVGAVARFREPIREALRSVTTEPEGCQLCQQALHYAESGDREFESWLYEFVERSPVADCPWVGQGQLLALGGEEAFRLIARLRGQRLERREWNWDDSAVVDEAIESFGEERAAALLTDTTDAAILRFADAWRRSQADVCPSFQQSPHAIGISGHWIRPAYDPPPGGTR